MERPRESTVARRPPRFRLRRGCGAPRRAARSSEGGPGRPPPTRSPCDLPRRSAASDRRSPSTRIRRPMARWVGVRSARSSARIGARSSSEAIRRWIAGGHQEAVAAGRRLRQALAGAEECRPGSLRRGARPRIDLTGDDDPAHRPALRVEPRPQDRRERVGAGPKQALDLVALGEFEVGQPRLGGIRGLQLRGERPQPGRRTGRVAAGADRRPRTARWRSSPQAN